MKIIAAFLLAVLALTSQTMAGPTLVIETTITVPNPRGGNDVVSPRIVVESGKEGSIEIADHKYSLTPTLRGDGSIEMRVIVTQQNPGAPVVIARPTLVVAPGEVAEIKVGQHVFKMKPTLVQAP